MFDDVHSGDQLISAVSHLTDDDADVRLHAYKFIIDTPLLPRALSTTQKRTLQDAILAILNAPQMWQNCWQACVFLSSIVLRFCDPKRGVELLAYGFEQTTDRRLRNLLLYNLRVSCFSSGIDAGFLLGDMFFRHYQDWFGSYAGPPPVFQPRPDRAIILMSQFLAPPHAPTVDALAKSKILRDRFGYDVAIVNTNENPCDRNFLYMNANISQRNRKLKQFQFFGEDQTQIYTPAYDMPTEDGYGAVFDFVARWQPAFILNYGAGNLSGEYLGQFAMVITMPAGTELLPTRTSRYAVSFRPLTDFDHEMIARYGMEKVRVIETRYNYDLPAPQKSYRREDFAVTAADFVVAVVGTRLESEIEETNIAMLRAILAIDPRIVIVFLGDIVSSVTDDLKKRLPADRLRFPGMIEDVPAFYKNVADLYVNPIRSGGGTSAAYALGFGLPAFTRRHGHVADLTHPDFVFDTENDLLAAVRTMMTDGAARDALRRKALAGFERIGSRERMLCDILTAAGLKTDGKPADPA